MPKVRARDAAAAPMAAAMPPPMFISPRYYGSCYARVVLQHYAADTYVLQAALR